MWLPYETVNNLPTGQITEGSNLRKHTGVFPPDVDKANDTAWLNGLLYKIISLRLPDFLLFF
jgi:hypothetical protein